MPDRLRGKTALVTGAARGLGEAMARMFVAEGARVALSDVLDEPGEALAGELGESATYLHLDVTRAEDWSAAVRAALDRWGALDVLVNNAGIGLAPALLHQRDPEDHRRILDVNLEGVWLGMRAVVEPMERGGGGSIVNIASIDGIVGVSGLTSYVASKFAVRGMTKSAAMEWGPRGVRVNSIHPGLIATPMLDVSSEELEEQLREVLDRQPIRRMGTPEEVALLAVYLASDESSYCTGSEFVIDGGNTAGSWRWDL